MAAAKKKTDVLAEVEDQIINAEVVEVVKAKEEAHGVTEKSSDALAEDSGEEVATKTAKAGRRSAKGQAEAETKLEKVEHQLHRDDEKIAEG